MNKLNLVIENAAESDMAVIAEYIAKDKKSAAAEMLKIFYEFFEKLSSYPEIGFL